MASDFDFVQYENPIRKIEQTKFFIPPGFPNKNCPPETGNCMQAAVASIIGLELEEVPHFMTFDNPTDTYYRFMLDHGLILWEMDAWWLEMIPRPWWRGLADVKRPTGSHHCTVYEGQKQFFDPNTKAEQNYELQSVDYWLPTELKDLCEFG